MTNVRRKPVVLETLVDDTFKVKPLPQPHGKWPYRLRVERFLPEIDERASSISFHVVGDTGSMKQRSFQHMVAREMTKQLLVENNLSAPSFMLHLGDVVYNYGEASEYPAQFFKPYEQYPAPIFALAGNHDADINPEAAARYESLDAFMKVFCAKSSDSVPFSESSSRLSVTQPNVYWTLVTPLANIICLYGNATKYGYISEEQEAWFVQELLSAQKDRPKKAIIVCVHQAPYSADTNHGSSLNMITFLERSFHAAGVKPDLVLSGHVHNYQRFSKHYEDGATVPYVVAGAGGYADLHRIAEPGDPAVLDDLPIMKSVHLENYCDSYHGFLKIKLDKQEVGILITCEYFTFSSDVQTEDAVLFERFYVPVSYPEYQVSLPQ
ncbi:metallophosphoesterase [Olivibacter sp. XZL3]|uniref:metallophosphoesterase family protein n=1 Tax=Olivibacter sp. XZL3 TaxID=1735116 RepID=UPI001065436C|nr:metallophosphoesterase [Olivibacter sp. XZL3]